MMRGLSLSQRPVAVIDIGSNSVRLVAYDRLGRAPVPMFNEKSLCGLGREVAVTGLLPEDGLVQARAALRGVVERLLADPRYARDVLLVCEAVPGGELVPLAALFRDASRPASGTPEPPGLTNRELLPALRRICHETPVVGIEVVEVAPHLDPGYTTTMNARRAIFECLSGLAMRRAGFPGPAYLHPDVAGPPDG